MLGLPTYAWPFIFAVIAFIASRAVTSRNDDARSPARTVLLGVAVACVVIGFALMWLGQH